MEYKEVDVLLANGYVGGGWPPLSLWAQSIRGCPILRVFLRRVGIPPGANHGDYEITLVATHPCKKRKGGAASVVKGWASPPIQMDL